MILIKLNRHFLWDQVGQHLTGWFTLISNRYHPVIISIIIIISIIVIIIIIISLVTISIINVICIVIFITIIIDYFLVSENSVSDILMTFASLLLTYIEYQAVPSFSGEISLLEMMLKLHLTMKLLKTREGQLLVTLVDAKIQYFLYA